MIFDNTNAKYINGVLNQSQLSQGPLVVAINDTTPRAQKSQTPRLKIL